MFFVTLYRLTKLAVQNFFRNFWLSVVTVTIIILSLFSVTTLIGLNAISASVLEAVNEKVDIALYFKTSIADEVVLLMRERITQIPEVGDVRLVTPGEGLELFKQKHKSDPLVAAALEEIGENPLGAVLLVRARDIHSYEQALESIRGLNIREYVDDIDFQDRRLLINRLRAITQKVSLAMTVTSVFFGLISILVVFNTIRLGIYAHREEISIMKLVGASNWFTRMPFIIEGFFYALLSTIIFWALFLAVINWLEPQAASFFGEIHFSPKGYFAATAPKLVLQQLVGITIINVFSAAIAIRRYLRV